MEITPTEGVGNYIKKEDWKAVTEDGKIVHQVIFKLKDLIKKENNSIWNNKEKKYVRDGEMLTDKDGDEHAFKTILYTKKDKVLEAFPGEPNKKGEPTTYLQKSFKFNRTVIVDNTEMTISVGIMANDELDKAIKMTRGFGKDPLDTIYKLCKTGEKIETKYWVEIVNPEDVEAQPEVQPEVTPGPVEKIVNPTPITDAASADKAVEDINTPLPTKPEPLSDAEVKLINDFKLGKLTFNDGTKVPQNKVSFIKAYAEKAKGDEIRPALLWTEHMESKK